MAADTPVERMAEELDQLIAEAAAKEKEAREELVSLRAAKDALRKKSKPRAKRTRRMKPSVRLGEHNEQLVLDALRLRGDRPASASEVARISGVPQGSVTAVLGRLLEAGKVERAGKTPRGGALVRLPRT